MTTQKTRMHAAVLALIGVPLVLGTVVARAHEDPKQLVSQDRAAYLCDGKPATIVGTDQPDKLTGTPGDDVIVGLDGSDRIFGLGGNDTICGGDSADILDGGAGDDRIFGQGNDQIDSDFIIGDELTGGPGNDYLDAGRSGCFGICPYGEQVSYLSAPRGVRVDLAKGVATGHGRDTLVNIRGVVGSPFDDRILGSDQANMIYAWGGNDVVYGRGGPDKLVGDTLDDEAGTKAPGNDRLYGGLGNDELATFRGIDVLLGGPGSDQLTDFGANSRTVFRGGSGNDMLSNRRISPREFGYGGPGHDSLSARNRGLDMGCRSIEQTPRNVCR